jgi:tetratricopeptide (TPR) repeat protein
MSLAAEQAAAVQKVAARAAPAVPQKELTAQQWFERGLAATDLNTGINLYSEAIRLKPDFAEAFYNRAIARRDEGDSEAAEEDFKKALRLAGYRS